MRAQLVAGRQVEPGEHHDLIARPQILGTLRDPLIEADPRPRRALASVAARVLLDDGHAGKTYDLTGPEALSHAEACAKLGAALGRAIHYVPVHDETARSAMLAAGLNHWMTDALIELYQDYRRSGTGGYAAQVHDTVQEVTGQTPRTLGQALAANLGPAASPGT